MTKVWCQRAAELIESFVRDVLNNGGVPAERDFAALSLIIEHMYCPAKEQEKKMMMSYIVKNLAEWADHVEVLDEYLNLMAECDDEFVQQFEEMWTDSRLSRTLDSSKF